MKYQYIYFRNIDNSNMKVIRIIFQYFPLLHQTLLYFLLYYFIFSCYCISIKIVIIIIGIIVISIIIIIAF